MNQAALRVLVTGAGAPGVRGTVFALKNNPEMLPVYLVGTDVKSDVVGKHFVDRFYPVPPPEDDKYLSSVLQVCQVEGIQVLIPQTTRENMVLSKHREEMAAHGVRVMTSSHHANQTANSKWELLRLCKELGIPYPEHRLTHSESDLVQAVNELGYPARPVVVKPPESNGMRGLRILREQAWDVDRFLSEKPDGLEIGLDDLLSILHRGRSWPELVAVEYLPGHEYSVDAFVGENASVVIPRLRKAIRSGISFENVLEYRSDLIDYTNRLAAHIGLKGTFGMQFKLDATGTPKILECNPRVQGTMVASTFSGVNVIWLGIQELLGRGPTSISAPQRPAQFYRFWGGIGVAEDMVDEI